MNDIAQKSDLIDMTVQIRATTDRAVLVERTTMSREPAWVPLSQVELAACDNGQDFTLTLPEWLALEKGLL